MRHYLLDASALVDFILDTREAKVVRVRAQISRMLTRHDEGKASLYIPNVCMAECSKAVAREVYESWPRERADDAYRRYVDALLEVVSSRRSGIIRSVPVRREHLEDIEDIFRLEYGIPARERKGRLSGVDALVISMGRRLARQHGDSRTVIVTAERWMAEVCARNRHALPAAVYAPERPVPDA